MDPSTERLTQSHSFYPGEQITKFTHGKEHPWQLDLDHIFFNSVSKRASSQK